MRKYKIRFGVVPSGSISDRILVLNPNYGEPIGPFGSRPVTPESSHYKKMESKASYYTKLEESVKEEGFKNPILCRTFEGETYSRYGTSRLWVAKRNQMEIPMLCADYDDTWEDLEELNTEEEVLSKFQDPPMFLTMTDDEFRFDGCRHFHLDDDTITHLDLIA